jgi:hypothetical protein
MVVIDLILLLPLSHPQHLRFFALFAISTSLPSYASPFPYFPLPDLLSFFVIAKLHSTVTRTYEPLHTPLSGYFQRISDQSRYEAYRIN